MAEQISLSDRYVLLLDEVVKENRELRQQLEEIHKKDEARMKTLSDKVDMLSSKVVTASSSRVRQTGSGRMRVPRMCSNDVRSHFKKLAATKDENSILKVQESDDSDHNLRVFHLMKDQLYHKYKGEDKCPWNMVQIQAAYKTYMKSKRSYARRCSKGVNEAHVTTCRQQNRKREKLGRRVKSLASKENWSDSKKAEVAEVMFLDYMSSEESDVEDDQRVYVVKPLPWESDELKKKKRSLDRYHLSSLSQLVRQRIAPRRKGQNSQRPKPESCPDWACI